MSNSKDEPAQWVPAGEDCMGQTRPGYWRQFLFCSDGSCLCAVDVDPIQANFKAHQKRHERERLLALPPRERIGAMLHFIKSENRRLEINEVHAAVLLLMELSQLPP